MMILNLSPVNTTLELSVYVYGEELAINTTDANYMLDFSAVPNGGELSAAEIDCPWIPDAVRRVNGILEVPLILPYAGIPWPTPPEAMAVTHPQPITVTSDGPVVLPHYDPPVPVPTDDEPCS